MLVMLSMSPYTIYITTTFIATTSHQEHAFVHMSFAVTHGIMIITIFFIMILI